MEHLSHITRFGLPGIDRIPFGMHACHFYSSRDQRVGTLDCTVNIAHVISMTDTQERNA